MLKRLQIWLLQRLEIPGLMDMTLQKATGGDLEKFLNKFPRAEILAVLFKMLKPPRQGLPLTEIQELSVLSAVSNEEFLKYLEAQEYDYLVAYFQAITPEDRLIYKGRYLEIAEKREKIKSANSELMEKDAEQALEKAREL